MKCRYEKMKEDRSGAAMAVVLCVTAVFFVLALLFLTMGARMVRASRRELDRSRCRVEAESFSDRLDEALADEGSELSRYLKAQIGGNVWQAGEKKCFVAEERDGEDPMSCPAGSLTVELSWESVPEEQADAGRPVTAYMSEDQADAGGSAAKSVPEEQAGAGGTVTTHMSEDQTDAGGSAAKSVPEEQADAIRAETSRVMQGAENAGTDGSQMREVVRLTVAVTCSSERDSCELVSEYDLNRARGPEDAGEVSWTWARVSRR